MSKKKATCMTKSDIIAEIADKSGFSKSDVKKVLGAQRDICIREVSKGHDILVVDLCKIKVQSTPARPARMGRDPRGGDKLIQYKAKPAGKKVKIRASSILKNAV